MGNWVCFDHCVVNDSGTFSVIVTVHHWVYVRQYYRFNMQMLYLLIVYLSFPLLVVLMDSDDCFNGISDLLFPLM